MFDKERLAILTARKAFRRGEEFKLASGRTTTYYIDLAQLMLDSEGLALMVAGLLPFAGNCFGGPSSGADMLVAGLLLSRPGSHAFLVKKPREGGKLEGSIPPEAQCLIVEDVTTTGGSALVACRHAIRAGGDIANVVSVVDRQEGAAEMFSEAGFRFTSLLTLEDVLKHV